MENAENSTNNNNKSFIAGAIIVAAIIIGGAIVYTQKATETKPTANINQATQEENKGNVTNPNSIWDLINPVSENDHVLGNPSAELSLILYFDINCGHCRTFHNTLTKFIKENGKEGQIKWVTRHFPLNQISQKEAEATECVAEIGGKEKFWQYLDELMENTIQPENMVDLEIKLTNLAQKMDIEKEAFKQCLTDGRYLEKITQTKNEAIGLGVEGTPFSIITDSNGKIDEVIAIPGALGYEDLKKLIDSKLNN